MSGFILWQGSAFIMCVGEKMIRDYEEKDAKVIKELLKEFVEFNEQNYAPEIFITDEITNLPAEIDVFLDEFVNKENSKFLVYEEDDELIAYIHGSFKDVKNRIKKREGYVSSLFVTKAHRGKGIASQLNESLVSWFKKQGCDHLKLIVFKGNLAKKIYERWGYKTHRYVMKKELN